MFAIMVEQGDGIYEDAGNSRPADGSRVFNEELSADLITNLLPPSETEKTCQKLIELLQI